MIDNTHSLFVAYMPLTRVEMQPERRRIGASLQTIFLSLLVLLFLPSALQSLGDGRDNHPIGEKGSESEERKRIVFVSIGSDDWGRWSDRSPIWPNEGDLISTLREVGGTGQPHLQTAESLDDIHALKATLEKLNTGVSLRQRVVLTPYVVVGGPDFEGMRSTGCPDQPGCSYRELLYPKSAGGLAMPPYNRGDLREAYHQMYSDRLWHPQYHGRSHFDTSAWIHYLRSGDSIARSYFNRSMTFVGSTDSSSLTGEYVSSDTARQKPPEEVREWLSGGLKAFEDWWGYRATVTAVPHHFAADSIVSAFGLEGLSMEYLVNQRSPFDNEEHGVPFIPRLDIDVENALAVHKADYMYSLVGGLKAMITRFLASNDFLSLQWHASNSMPSLSDRVRADPASAYVRHEHLPHIVSHIRDTFPNAIFVTSAELSQIMQKGFSEISWGALVMQLRNYNHAAQAWTVPQPPSGASEAGLLRRECEPREEQCVRGGDEVELGAMCEYELRWDAEPRCEDAAKASDLDHGPYDPSGGVHAVKAPEVDSDGGGADQWAELLYYWRTHASQDESSRLNVMMQQGRDSEVADVCRRIRAEALAAQSAEHARICERCRLCYTCTTSAVAPLPPLPYFVFPEDHSGSLWRERTSRRPDRGVDDVSISIHIDGSEITASVSGYDFEEHGGYAILARGVTQLSAWQGEGAKIRTDKAVSKKPTGPPQGSVLFVCLMSGNGRPLGVCQSEMHENGDAMAPAIVRGEKATRYFETAWLPGEEVTGFPTPPAAPRARAPEGARVAFVITSCVAMEGRLTLLEETVLTFLASNTYPIDRYILIDDSGNASAHSRLIALFGSTFHVLLNVRPRTGQMHSIDAAYALALSGGAQYIYHCQDDWRFHTRGDFVGDSLRLLEDLPDAMVVWSRDQADHGLPLGPRQESSSGVGYRQVVPTHKWKGFTFNPGLRRARDYVQMAPMQRYWYEDNVQGYMRWMGMYGVSLEAGWVVHTGDDFSTKPSYQWANSERVKTSGAQ